MSLEYTYIKSEVVNRRGVGEANSFSKSDDRYQTSDIRKRGTVVEYLKQDYLVKKIEELEEKIHQLRVSRRILMNLIENIEREKNLTISQLTTENKKLKLSNARYAKNLLDLRKDAEI